MLQKEDYIVREIQKIGLLMVAIYNKIMGIKENLATPLDEQLVEVKTDFLDQIGFDLEKFLIFSHYEIEDYLSQFDGFNAHNIELLAQIIAEIGYLNEADITINYLDKSLYLYELACQKDDVYSFLRESNMEAIREKREKLGMKN